MGSDSVPVTPTRRGSARLQRVGVVLLAGFIVLYLAVITFALHSDLSRRAPLMVLVGSWLVGLVALFLLVRGYRAAGHARGA